MRRGGARVELEAAPLGGDGDAQRVAREHELGRGAVERHGLRAGAAVFAGAEDLHDASATAREFARRRHFLDNRFDVGAQEFRRPVAGRADEMEVPRVAIGRLEARAAFAEIHLARDARRRPSTASVR